MLTAEQILSAQKSNIDVFFGLSSKAFEGVEELVRLNLQTIRTAMNETSDAARAALSAKDVQELASVQANFLQPVPEKAAAYSRHAYEIASATASEVTQVARSTVSDAQAKFMEVVDSAVKSAPLGSENVVSLFRSAMSAGTNAYEGMQRAASQATTQAADYVRDVQDTQASAAESLPVVVAGVTQSASKGRRAS